MTGIINQTFGMGDGDSVMLLGDIEFGNMEVPASFNFGGNQILSSHQLVGGKRVVNSIGKSDHNLSWSGMFLGESAAERAKALDFLRSTGEQVEFVFGEMVYLVVIESYTATFERYYQIPYSINLHVVENLSIPAPIAEPIGYNNAVNDDLTAINNQLTLANSAELSTAYLNLKQSIENAGNLNNSSSNQLNAIKNNIASMQSINDKLIQGGGI